MKMIIKVLIAGMVAVVGMTACIDDNWNLDNLKTDDLVIADSLVAPLGSVQMSAEYLLKDVGGEVNVPGDYPIVYTDSIKMNIELDETIANIMVEAGGEFYILILFDNQTDATFSFQADFVSETDGTVSLTATNAPPREIKTFENQESESTFQKLIGADHLKMTIARTDTGEITLYEEDYIKITFVLFKKGGIINLDEE